MKSRFLKAFLFGNRFCKHPLPSHLIEILFGGIAYGLLEIIWRGYTHPSMVITGGLCFGMMLAVNRYFAKMPLILKSAVCALGITAAEFCVGMLVNRLWQMDVWDYSDEWLHLFGQICPLYSCIWFLISLCICALYHAVFVVSDTGKKSATLRK